MTTTPSQTTASERVCLRCDAKTPNRWLCDACAEKNFPGSDLPREPAEMSKAEKCDHCVRSGCLDSGVCRACTCGKPAPPEDGDEWLNISRYGVRSNGKWWLADDAAERFKADIRATISALQAENGRMRNREREAVRLLKDRSMYDLDRGHALRKLFY